MRITTTIYSDWLPKEYIGDRIKRLRTEHNMLQADLATAVGVTRSHIANIETGTFDNIGLHMLIAFAKVFDVTVQQLLEDVDF